MVVLEPRLLEVVPLVVVEVVVDVVVLLLKEWCPMHCVHCILYILYIVHKKGCSQSTPSPHPAASAFSIKDQNPFYIYTDITATFSLGDLEHLCQ